MSTTTPNRGYPIPEGSDAASGLAGYIAQLGQAVDADTDTIGHDTGWVTLTVTNAAWTAGAAAPQRRRIGPWVALSGTVGPDGITGSSDWTDPIFAALPSNMRPAEPWIIATTNPNAGVQAEMKVDTDGTVSFRSVGANPIPAGSFCSIATVFPTG